MLSFTNLYFRPSPTESTETREAQHKISDYERATALIYLVTRDPDCIRSSHMTQLLAAHLFCVQFIDTAEVRGTRCIQANTQSHGSQDNFQSVQNVTLDLRTQVVLSSMSDGGSTSDIRSDQALDAPDRCRGCYSLQKTEMWMQRYHHCP